MAMLKTNDLIKSNIYKIKTEIDLQTFNNNFDTEHQNEWQCTSQWKHHGWKPSIKAFNNRNTEFDEVNDHMAF